MPKLVADAASRVEYTASGHLVYVNDGTLLAQRFDLDNLKLLGEPTAIAEGVRVFKPTGTARFTASQTGVLAFETTINYSPRLVWFDRNGQMLDTLTMPGPIKSLRLSPDGQRLAVDVVDVRTGISDVWLPGRRPRRATALHLPGDRRGESDLVGRRKTHRLSVRPRGPA